MATYYVRADGTAANKAAATSDAAASTSMSVATHNGETYSADDVIVVSDAGGVYRGTRLNPPSSGSAGHPIIYQASGSPLLKGSADISTAAHTWTASGVGTNCYYCRTAASGDPSLTDPGAGMVFLDDVSCTKGASVAALTDHQWFYGDADTLGYNTIYVRDDTGDPDTSGVLIEASQIGCAYIYDKSYITVDGLEVRHGTQTADYIGGLLSTVSDHIIIQNCEAHWNSGNGLCIKGSDSTIDNCVASYNGSHNISAGGWWDIPSTGMTLSNNVTHHAWTVLYSGEDPWDGYGLKFLFCQDSFMYGNESYANAMQGIDLDGSHSDAIGSLDNFIYENEVHDNIFQGILIEIFSTGNKVYRNLVYNNGVDDSSYVNQPEISIFDHCPNNEIFNNVIYKDRGTASDDMLCYIGDWESGNSSKGTKFYNNTMHGHGYAKYGIRVDGYACPEDMVIKNNIIVGTINECLFIQGSSFTGFTSDYNCLRRDPANTSVINRDYSGYTIGPDGTHYSSLGQDYHSFTTDPALTDAGANNYTLSVDSPCINAGVDLGATYDDGLMPSSTWPSGVVTGDQDNY